MALNFCIRAVRSASNLDPAGMLDEPGASISPLDFGVLLWMATHVIHQTIQRTLNLADVALAYVCVNLRRLGALVSQELLNIAQVCT